MSSDDRPCADVWEGDSKPCGRPKDDIVHRQSGGHPYRAELPDGPTLERTAHDWVRSHNRHLRETRGDAEFETAPYDTGDLEAAFMAGYAVRDSYEHDLATCDRLPDSRDCGTGMWCKCKCHGAEQSEDSPPADLEDRVADYLLSVNRDDIRVGNAAATVIKMVRQAMERPRR